MDTPNKIISIATGIGGLESGLELAGLKLRVSIYVEIEAFIISNLVAAMETGALGAAPIWADVKTFPAKEFYQKIHGITAGYPCQPFSQAGKRSGSCDPRHIFPSILRIIKAVVPIWIFLENVEGHLSLGYDEVYRNLHDMGYKIEAGIFSAEEVGAPHQRRRLFILAVKMEYSNAATLSRILFGDDPKLPDPRGTGQVADTNHADPTARYGSVQSQTGSPKKKTRLRKRLLHELSSRRNAISNTHRLRSRESLTGSKSKQPLKDGYQWVARQGERQYEWEEPRTTQSRVGGAADGYDYRIDLLRALGNGVVRQTAAKAFLTLLAKFK